MNVPVWAPLGSTRDPVLEGQEEGLNRSCDRRCAGDPADITSAPITPTQSFGRDLHHQFSADLHSVFLLLSIKLKVSSAQLLSEKDIVPISV